MVRIRAAGMAAAAAALIALTGCATTVTGTPMAGESAVATGMTSSSATPDSSSDQAATSNSPAEPTPSEGSGSGSVDGTASSSSSSASRSSLPSASSAAGNADTVLSGADAAWLRTFCTGFANVAEHTSPDTTGASKSKTITAVVDAYQAMADAATKAATDLEKLPEPAFPGHETVAPGVHDWFEAVASVYGTGAKTIANGSYATPSDLSDAIDQVESQMDAANNDLGTAIGEIDPSVSNAIVAAPECAALVGGAH